MKKLITILLCIIMVSGLLITPALADSQWPEELSISAEGGIVMDADTGTVLYGQNMNETYFPASITKILTALIVIENCKLDEVVTFSKNALSEKNLEYNSSNVGMSVGEEMTVRECLYALLLASANEVANALAEHTAGSIEAFAVMMNQKAQELGCQNSHFVNPSGLNNPDHYTSAYDMALISKAAFENETFVEIDSALFFPLPPNKGNPNGVDIYAHHKMMKPRDSVYYPGIIGGKTGYTTLAGNTLVTCAQKDGMKLIAVVLNGYKSHYVDTKALLDFGFNNFQTLDISNYETKYTTLDNDMSIADLPTANLSILKLSPGYKITLPKFAEFGSVQSAITYQLTPDDPDDAVAKLEYTYGNRNVGHTYLEINQAALKEENQPQTAFPDTASALLAETNDMNSNHLMYADETEGLPATESDAQPDFDSQSDSQTTSLPAKASTMKKLSKPVKTFLTVIGVILLLSLIIGIIFYCKLKKAQKEETERILRRERRIQRLKESGYSETEFDMMMVERRSSYTTKRRGFFKKKRF